MFGRHNNSQLSSEDFILNYSLEGDRSTKIFILHLAEVGYLNLYMIMLLLMRPR